MPLSRLVTLAFAVLVLAAAATASAPTGRRAYDDADHDVRWNADHHAGHGMPETLRSREGAGAEAANPARGTPPRRRARQQRSLHRATSTHTIADADPAVGGSLHSAAHQQPQRADQPTQISLFHLTGAWGTIPPTATPTFATISPGNGSAVPTGPTARLQFMARTRLRRRSSPPSKGVRHTSLLGVASSTQAFRGYVEQRNNENPEHGGSNHAAEHRRAHGVAGDGPGSLRNDQRK